MIRPAAKMRECIRVLRTQWVMDNGLRYGKPALAYLFPLPEDSDDGVGARRAEVDVVVNYSRVTLQFKGVPAHGRLVVVDPLDTYITSVFD